MGAVRRRGHDGDRSDSAESPDGLVHEKRLRDVPVLLRDSLENLEVGRHSRQIVLLAELGLGLEDLGS